MLPFYSLKASEPPSIGLHETTNGKYKDARQGAKAHATVK